MADTALATQADVSKWLIADERRHKRAMDKIAEQFAEGESLKITSLPQITVPSGAAVQNERQVPRWIMPDGSTQERIQGLTIYRERERLFWKDPYGQGETGPPDCSATLSFGETHGTATPVAIEMFGHMGVGGRCMDCKMKEFGTEIRADGSNGPGKACGRPTTLYMIQPDKPLPVVVTVTELNYENVRDFYMAQVNEGFYDDWEFVTEITLMRRVSRTGGMGYAMPAFAALGGVDAEVLPRVQAQAEFWVPRIEQSIRERKEATERRRKEAEAEAAA